jgi:uncharacterized protein (DUF427 family)
MDGDWDLKHTLDQQANQRNAHPQRIQPGPGQESVWDYPRPPRVEDSARHIQVILNGVMIADSTRAKRVLETSHAPTYYLPLEDVRLEHLAPSPRRTICEWKGQAVYFTVTVAERSVENAAWSYPEPTGPFAAIRDHIAFYPHEMDACLVDGERAAPQPGGFYGGWVTSDIVGPFKGGPGSLGW